MEAWLTLSNDLEPAPWKDRIQKFISDAQNFFSTLSLLNFLAFLINGKYKLKLTTNLNRYRSLPDRIIKLRLMPLTKSVQHHLLSYEFLNRQLTWTSLTEFLLFILPLISPSYRRIHRKLSRLKKPVGEAGEFAALPVKFCAICFSKGREGRFVTNPYCGECGHCYCYTCLIGEVVGEEGDGWNCLRCNRSIRNIRRWEEITEGKDTVNQEKKLRTNDIPAEEAGDPSTEGLVSETEDEEGSAASDDGVEIDEENLFSR